MQSCVLFYVPILTYLVLPFSFLFDLLCLLKVPSSTEGGMMTYTFVMLTSVYGHLYHRVFIIVLMLMHSQYRYRVI